MRALILWSNPTSTNLGVQALAAGTAALLIRTFGETVDPSYQGYGPGDAPVRIGDPWRLARRLATPGDELIDWVRTFDVVVDTRAGDSFADIYGMRRHLTMSLMHQAALRARVPVVLGPQTVGPFSTRRSRVLAAQTARTARLVMARDDRSQLTATDLQARSVLLTTDVVFALPIPTPSRIRRDVLLNVSGLLWGPNPHVDHISYQGVVREVLERLLEQGREISLLAHVLDSPIDDNDVPVVRSIAAEYGIEAVVPRDLSDVRAIAASASALIGSRMHACLNAISVGTPAVSLAYSRKFAPLLSQLGWSHTVDLRDNPRSASSRVNEVLSSSAIRYEVQQVRERADKLIVRASDKLLTVI